MDPSLKKKTEKVLSEMGLTPSQAITLFYKQIGYYRGLPFDVRLPHEPNEETIQAIEDSIHGRNLTKVNNIDELFAELEK
jgi:DNA-damage-inducible protein J